ncbi:MAG: hypothetical protein JWO43_117 [Candidatus Adlerbacteria bacterium]|nr:hypothetical protein [Candidatus Adlerbacteria bacterium]
MDKLTAINTAKKQLVADIRDYVRGQQESWRRIPWLALQADGRGRYPEFYSRCYRLGLWSLHFSTGQQYCNLIDCATGEIVCSTFKPADDAAVLSLAYYLDRVDTSIIIENLQREASKKISSWSSRKEHMERAVWRRQLIKELSLTKLYVRPEEAAAA